MRLVYGACGCHVGQKAMALATCMLRVGAYACAVIHMSFLCCIVLYGISLFNSIVGPMVKLQLRSVDQPCSDL